jgi:hypothetical protein
VLQLIQKLLLGPPPKPIDMPKLLCVDPKGLVYDGKGAITGFAINLTRTAQER